MRVQIRKNKYWYQSYYKCWCGYNCTNVCVHVCVIGVHRYLHAFVHPRVPSIASFVILHSIHPFTCLSACIACVDWLLHCTHAFAHPSNHALHQLLVPCLRQPIYASSIQSFNHVFAHRSVNSLIRAFAHWSMRSFLHPLIKPAGDPFRRKRTCHSFIHPPAHSTFMIPLTRSIVNASNCASFNLSIHACVHASIHGTN